MTKNSIKQLQVTNTTKNELLTKIPFLAGKKVAILGDVGLDEYILGEVKRISPEAPVPVLEVENEDMRLGLSANVAQNVSALGGIPLLVSVIGNDSGADRLGQLFKKADVGTDFLVTDHERPTTRKTRVMAKHHHLVRVDYELKKYLAPAVEEKLFTKLKSALDQADILIIEDYSKGVISENVIQKVTEYAHQKKLKVLVDPHRSHSAEFYKGVDLIKPNYDESFALAGISQDQMKENPNLIIEVGQSLFKKTGAKELVITCGKDGMIIFNQNQIEKVPTYARQVFDVTGAGDTVIAALALSLAAGLTLSEASLLANFAAGVVVGQVGCVPCTVAELKDYIQNSN